jgi:hypothetical protein
MQLGRTAFLHKYLHPKEAFILDGTRIVRSWKLQAAQARVRPLDFRVKSGFYYCYYIVYADVPTLALWRRCSGAKVRPLRAGCSV